MKRIWLAAVSLLLVFALAACDGEDVVKTMDTTAGEVVTIPSVQTTQPSATPEAPTSQPQIQLGSGIFAGMTPTDIWSKVLGSLADSTGLDVSMNIMTEYITGQEGHREEQNVHILLNVGEYHYSYAVETETKQIFSETTSTVRCYKAFKDGWYYQSICVDDSDKPEPSQSSAKIAVTEESLTEHGLDLETILAINSMVNMGVGMSDEIGQELNAIFREVSYVELDGGRSQIVCKGMQADKLIKILMDSIRELGDNMDGIVKEEIGVFLASVAQMLSCDVTLTISATGIPESLVAGLSLDMTETKPFAVTTEYTLTVNAVGANAGKVTLPEATDQYPEYASFADYLKEVYGN